MQMNTVKKNPSTIYSVIDRGRIRRNGNLTTTYIDYVM